jgi:hypothetical protein
MKITRRMKNTKEDCKLLDISFPGKACVKFLISCKKISENDCTNKMRRPDEEEFVWREKMSGRVWKGSF